jgi:nicotinamide riboside kinase
LFCDTSPLTTALYSQLLFGRVSRELEVLAESRYALTVYCAPDFPFVQDGTRVGPEFQAEQDVRTRQELKRRGIPFLQVHGPVSERVVAVLDALDLRCGR